MELPPIDKLPFMRKKRNELEYLHRPPLIKPNYGRPQRSLLPKTNISRVLLYDNTTQEQMRDVKLKYIEKQRHRLWRINEVNNGNFLRLQEKREARHKVQLRRYQDLKDAFIAEYGTQYMPVAEKDTEEDPFLLYARLAPPINVLCYFLEQQMAQQEEDANKKKEKEKTLTDTEGMFSKFKADPLLPQYAHSVEDPRFISLTETLARPSSDNDGYLQLSPGYLQMKGKPTPKRRRLSGITRRVITLPKFYTRALLASRESTASSHRTSRSSSMYEDTASKRSRVLSLADMADN